jgi:hypothetical protein
MRYILCLSGLLALAACHGGDQQSDAAQPAPAEVAAQDDTPNPTESPIDPDPQNPLVGDWRLDSGLTCIYDRVTFTEDMRVLHRTGEDDQPARDLPTPVDKYVVTGSKVQVNAVGEDKPVTYVFLDANHISDGTAACRFHKVG